MNCGFAVKIDIVFPVNNKVILAKGRWEDVLLWTLLALLSFKKMMK